MSGDAVQVRDLRKTYGEVVAVDDISFSVEPTEIFGILGPNGAGKSTTVELLAGVRTGDAGSVSVLGIDPWHDRGALSHVLGIQLQESRLQPKITVREVMELWSSFYRHPRPWLELLDRLGLSDRLDHRFAQLSGGQQQRLSIALALVGRPRVVVLDELSTGLDPRSRRDVQALVREIRETGTTVLLVTHDMEEAQLLCDRVAIIDSGRVRALDTPDGLIRGATAAVVTTFHATTPVDVECLRGLADVSAVSCDGGRISVTGDETTALAVVDELAAQGVRPQCLRVTDGTLDSAYLDLTLGDAPEGAPA